MKYYRRIGRDRAISANITVWRRLVLTLIALFWCAALYPRSALFLIPMGIAVFAFISAVHVAILKLRTTSWP